MLLRLLQEIKILKLLKVQGINGRYKYVEPVKEAKILMIN